MPREFTAATLNVGQLRRGARFRRREAADVARLLAEGVALAGLQETTGLRVRDVVPATHGVAQRGWGRRPSAARQGVALVWDRRQARLIPGTVRCRRAIDADGVKMRDRYTLSGRYWVAGGLVKFGTSHNSPRRYAGKWGQWHDAVASWFAVARVPSLLAVDSNHRRRRMVDLARRVGAQLQGGYLDWLLSRGLIPLGCYALGGLHSDHDARIGRYAR